jgi:ABC-type transport system involved in multi-copper enzyme maturation permease subunit
MSLREHLRSRFYSVALVFGGLLIYVSALLGALAADQEIRVLTDFGLSAIEILSAAAAAFAAASGLIQEMESKTIYLVLSRPVSRGAYLAGRSLGLAASGVCAIALMSAAHLSLLACKGWGWDWAYLWALSGIALKVVVACALASLLSLLSTSVLSGLLMTGILWVLGHFVEEIRFLSGRLGPLGKSLSALVYLVPNLQLFNFRDRLSEASAEPWAFALLYAALYCGACFAGTLLLFRKREF